MLREFTKRFGSGGEKSSRFDWEEKNRQVVALINSGKVSEAMAPAQELLTYVDKKYRRDSREKATTYNNMGMVFLLSGDYMLAEDCFREALDMRKRLYGEHHKEVAVILMNLAQLYKMEAQEILLANRVETDVSG